MDSDLEDLKKQTEIDNSKLEELMKSDLTVEMQNEFFEIFRESQLFLPVTYNANLFEGIENLKPGDVFQPESQVGFDINYLTDNDGNRAVPLFTSSEIMESAGIRSSAIAIFMSDLAEMLKQTDRYQIIAVNPFTPHDINMPINVFLSLFGHDDMMDTLKGILKLLKEKSVELEEDYAFFVPSEENFMMEDAVDGVFVPNIPFNASSRKDFKKDWKYLNILLMPKGNRILYIGDIVDDDAFDTIIAPGSEFHLEKELDEFTTVWKCRAQPFYDGG